MEDQKDDELRYEELSKTLRERVLDKNELDEWKKLDKTRKKKDNHKNNIFPHNLCFI
jgi:hypothetical protein